MKTEIIDEPSPREPVLPPVRIESTLLITEQVIEAAAIDVLKYSLGEVRSNVQVALADRPYFRPHPTHGPFVRMTYIQPVVRVGES